MNWNRLSLFKLPNSHKRFEYVPRYYDPKKEELKKKLEATAAKENNEVLDSSRTREISFRAKTADRWSNSAYKTQNMRANLRLVLILAGVIILFYFIFQALDGMGIFIDENLRK